MKKTCLISCPIDTYSGYGARSRDIVKGIVESMDDVWNIQILSQKWGSLPLGFLSANQEFDLLDRVVDKVDSNPDIWIQISIPNEFQRVGKSFNIGITAGIETDRCDPSWIEGANRMDEIWVSSQHAKTTLSESSKPIKVVFEGYDADTYTNHDTMANLDINLALNSLPEDFCFLYTGHWIGRKNVDQLVRIFLSTFSDRENAPALVLKTQVQSNSLADRTRIDKIIKGIRKSFPDQTKLPKVYVLQGDLTDSEMNELYNHSKIKAMVSLSRGEGFGRPLLEFSAVGKPIATSRWSGPLDYLNPKYTTLLPGKVVEVPQQFVNQWIIEGSKWFEVDTEVVKSKLVDLFENYEGYIQKAKRQQQYVAKKYTTQHMNSMLSELIKDVDRRSPKQVEVKLPQL